MTKPPLSQLEFVVLLSLITALTALSIDAMLPALTEIGVALDVGNPNDTQLIVTVFFLGMVFGELPFGPLSDAIGRKAAILIGMVIFSVGAVIAAAASSMEVMLIGRLIQGFGASGPKIASRALIRDQYRGDAMARIMSIIYMVFILIPMLAPAMGQAVLAVAGWRMIFAFFVAFAVIGGVWLSVRQPETLPPERRIPIRLPTLARNAALIVRHPGVMGYTVAVGLIFGAFLLYLSTSEALFRDLYGIEDLFPLYFAILAFGFGLASFLNSKLVMRLGMYRLSVAALVAMIVCGAVFFAVSWGYAGVPPFPVFMVAFSALFFSAGLLFGNLNALAMQVLGRVAGIGASVVSSLSSLIAFVVAFAIGRFYDGTALPLIAAFTLTGLAALGLSRFARRAATADI